MIRRFLKSLILWLLRDEKPSTEISVHCGDRMVVLRAVGVCGLNLLCGGEGTERLVRVEDVVDKEHFIRVWRSLGGVEACWEDGSRYDSSM